MAHVLEVEVSKKCPRCGCIKAKLSVVNFRFSSECGECGLTPNIEAVDEETAKTKLINHYYEYEAKNKKGLFKKVVDFLY